jgi:hypothetical protein
MLPEQDMDGAAYVSFYVVFFIDVLCCKCGKKLETSKVRKLL